MQVPTMPEQAGKPQSFPLQPDSFAEKPWLTVEEAALLFQEHGLPRSHEAIRGYARKGKITATSMEGAKGEQHMLDAASARAFIAERKAVLTALSRNDTDHTSMVRKLPVTSVPFRDMPDDAGMTRNAESKRDLEDALAAKEAEIEDLRRENRSLEIDKRVREQMLERVEADRQTVLERVMEMGIEVGQLRERIEHLQLGAGETPVPPPPDMVDYSDAYETDR